MKKSRLTEEQIAFALRPAESGTPVVEVGRRIGVTSNRFSGGKGSTRGWAWRSCNGSSSLRTRTASSSCWRGTP